ncbi:MAG TPA: formimidoylglutamase [Chitinophagaceae bacterium]|nr:formimidoylglutamase [Chitinophagaceae bacterium]
MSHFLNLSDFLSPVNTAVISDDEGYRDGQIGKSIKVYEEHLPDIDEADIVIIGCGERRGCGGERSTNEAPDAIRAQFYQLFYWHNDVKLVDLGNIKAGASLNDTYAALKTVIKELAEHGKTVVILGGSHDLTLAQYYAYADNKQIIEAACIDARIDLNIDTPLRAENFLMEVLTGEPNFLRHYNHIGFQSYYVHPHMLETMDKLRFDCIRVGNVKDNIEEMEPVIRNCNLFSFDISAIANAFAPATTVSPNGLNGEEACMLMRYAGLSPQVNTIGIYGFSPEKDRDALTAKQISHMLWYLIDGKSRSRHEAALEHRESFNEYHIAFGEVDTVFLQSKKTGRWWMQIPDKRFIACSANDYMMAGSNEIPERWLRAQERS